MKKAAWQLAIVLSLLLTNSLQAQYLDIGLLAGVSNYQGDLAPSSLRSSFGQTHAAFGAHGRYNINNYFGVKLSFNYATISGDDAQSQSQSRKLRNLSFRSNIYELALIGEWNIIGFQPYNLERTFSPYIFAGVAGFKFNPRAELDFQWHDLQPLGTEGQGIDGRPAPYSLIQLSIPLGAGLKYAINDYWSVGIDLGVRKTFTDYLDDVSTTYVSHAALLASNGEVAADLGNRTAEIIGGEPVTLPSGSQRGDPTNDDWYFIGGLTVTYNFLDNGLVGSRSKRRKRSGCPTF